MAKNPFRPSNDVWEETLALAEEHTAWKSFALETKKAADYMLGAGVENGFSCYKYVRILFGFALENVAKGVLVPRDPPRYEHSRSLPRRV